MQFAAIKTMVINVAYILYRPHVISIINNVGLQTTKQHQIELPLLRPLTLTYDLDL